MRLPARPKAMSLKRSYVSNLSEIESKPAKISKQKENVIIYCIVENDMIAENKLVK